jgi:transposase
VDDPERLRATAHEVCIDVCEAYTSAVKKVLPQARIVADRFHAAKMSFSAYAARRFD